MTSPFGTPKFPRGRTLEFTTTFFDFNGNIVQPNSAIVNLVMADGTTQQLTMTGPTPPATVWTATLDTRNAAAPGTVYWSVHSVPPIPSSVEDGFFELTANPANLLTF